MLTLLKAALSAYAVFTCNFSGKVYFQCESFAREMEVKAGVPYTMQIPASMTMPIEDGQYPTSWGITVGTNDEPFVSADAPMVNVSSDRAVVLTNTSAVVTFPFEPRAKIDVKMIHRLTATEEL